MWIKKSILKNEQDCRKGQAEIIKKQKEIIKNLEDKISIYEKIEANDKNYIKEVEKHYNFVNQICNEMIETNKNMAKTISILQAKNQSLQVSLDDAREEIDFLESKDDEDEA